MTLSAQWDHYKARSNEQLEIVFEQALAQHDEQLVQAMRYSTQNGGKRFRALLVYASGHCFDVAPKALDAAATALELIHAYSLVHDDLPSMDDDDMRRGKASCHKAYDEATAVLAGDALQTLAFEVLAHPNANISPKQSLQMLQMLAHASGLAGMAGGQALDIISTGKTLTLTKLQDIHERKTGALIRAALSMGALAAKDISQDELQLIDQYGQALGLAFQVIDDILDQTQTSEQLGKPSGADQALGKNTYPALMGLEPAKKYADELIHSAQQSLGKIERETKFLYQLAQFTRERHY